MTHPSTRLYAKATTLASRGKHGIRVELETWNLKIGPVGTYLVLDSKVCTVGFKF